MSCDPKDNHDHDHFFFSKLKILSKFSLFLIPQEVSPHLPACLNKSIVCTNKFNSEQERRAWWVPQVWLAVLMSTITPASSPAFPPLPWVRLWRRQLRLTDVLRERLSHLALGLQGAHRAWWGVVRLTRQGHRSQAWRKSLPVKICLVSRSL